MVTFVLERFDWPTSGVLILLMTTWCYSWSTYAVNAQGVGTPTSETVCAGTTTTLTCNITDSGGLTPVWRVFRTSNTSGPQVTSLNSGDNSPPYNYPTVQPRDTVARLEVAASSSVNGHHFQCVLYFVNLLVSPNLGNITIITDPSCPSSVVAAAHDDNDGITVTWQQPPNTPPVTFTTVTYCPTSSPNCGNSMNCTNNPCTISGLDPGTEYQFTVIPNNNCGSPTGCTENNATAQTAYISAGVVPRVELFITLTSLVPLCLQFW